MARYAITVRGVVQGVGFRPFVYGLATQRHLNGFVKNRAGSVLIEVEGKHASLHRFLEELQLNPPPLSRIETVEWQPSATLGETNFRIEASDGDESGPIFISPDIATCADCLAELFDASDRRYRYPFLNCTNCGPRLTIIEGAPYDRERTTMSRFSMCPACRAEYNDPRNRRFHAQPTACPVCGPRLMALRPNGERITADDPLTVFVDAVMHGGIGALKGLGGYHLVCDARDEQAVHNLRLRKHRDEKPFAIMVRDGQVARRMCVVSSDEGDLLESHQRPIVLLRKRHDGTTNDLIVAEAVAPDNPYLGVMLPYTPLHHLLMEAVNGVPLVMTSGNRSDEPIAYGDDDAIERLGKIADVFLSHDRPIRVRCDDSITRRLEDDELPIRRSRGYAPHPIKLPIDCPCPMLCVGGQFKGVFALGRDKLAFLSHHLGDLDHFTAQAAFKRDVRLYQQLFDIQPQLVVHDLHPDYASTGYALRRASDEGLATFAVQHHHAHVASCMAEHGLNEPVIGVAFDGTGYGTDGAIWGGEFFVGDYSEVSREMHLRYVRLPGGDVATREPWRIGLSYLLDAGCGDFRIAGPTATQCRGAEQMIERGLNSPFTSSVGRLFDAVASIAGVRSRVSFEGQAAMQLEWLAMDVDDNDFYPFELSDGVDTRPLVRAIVDDVRRHTSAAVIAKRFHSTLVEIIVTVCRQIQCRSQLKAVALSGGVFLNALLTREVCARLRAEGFRVYRHRLVPPSDAGLSLGQLAVAARRIDMKSVETITQRVSHALCST